MEIRMPISFLGNYLVVTRQGGSESREKCQKLSVRELSEQEKGRASSTAQGEGASTHQIVFYSFGCKRIIEGRVKENQEEKFVLQSGDKEYEFSSLKGAR